MRGRRIGLIATAAAVVGFAVPAGASGAAVSYQADVAHSGFVANGPNPPLGRKWIRRDLGVNVSYPVIAEGKVFVTAQAGSSSSSSQTGPTLLYALNRQTGATIWVREVATLGSPAYEDGRLYVLGNQALDAVTAATGERLWRRDLDRAAGGSPVPDGPFVYVSDEDGAHAVSAATGLIARTVPLPLSGFAVAGERVFVAASGCSRLAAYSRGLAQQVWARSVSCPGFAAPASPAFHSVERTPPFERLWARGAGGVGGIVVDALTSLGTEEFSSLGGLAFSGELAVLRRTGNLEARNSPNGTIQWLWDAGGNAPLSSPLAVRDAIWTLTQTGDVVALRRGDGNEQFRINVGATPMTSSPYSSSPSRIHDGMAADTDGLIVPSGDRLTALGPGGDAAGVLDPDREPGATTTITASVRPRDVEFGSKAVIEGQVKRTGGSGVPVDDQLELQADPYPYGVWETVATGKASDGSYGFSHRPDRNTRYRVVDIATAPAVISKELQVYAFPRIRLKLGFRSRTRTFFNVTIEAPDFLNLSKQRLYVYGLRTRKSVGVRVASIPIKRVKGTRYRARRTIRVPSGPTGNYVFVCVKIKDTRQLTRLNGKAWGCGRSRF